MTQFPSAKVVKTLTSDQMVDVLIKSMGDKCVSKSFVANPADPTQVNTWNAYAWLEGYEMQDSRQFRVVISGCWGYTVKVHWMNPNGGRDRVKIDRVVGHDMPDEQNTFTKEEVALLWDLIIQGEWSRRPTAMLMEL
jgi:hypothetical protein